MISHANMAVDDFTTELIKVLSDHLWISYPCVISKTNNFQISIKVTCAVLLQKNINESLELNTLKLELIKPTIYSILLSDKSFKGTIEL